MASEELLNKVTCIDFLEGLKILPDSSVDMILTDIPYKVYPRSRIARTGFSPEFSKVGKGSDIFKRGLPDKDAMMREFHRVLKPMGHCYIFAGLYDFLPLLSAADKHGWSICNQLIWCKNNQIMNRYFMKKLEYCWMFCRKIDKRKYINNLSQSDLLCYNIEKKKNKIHCTQKPIPLLENIIEQSSNPNDIILDAFAGSSSTGIAALNKGRRFIGFEIDEVMTQKANNWLNSVKGGIGNVQLGPQNGQD